MVHTFDEVIGLRYFNLNVLNSWNLGGKITVTILYISELWDEIASQSHILRVEMNE